MRAAVSRTRAVQIAGWPDVIAWRGHEVRRSYVMPVPTPMTFDVELVRARADRVQGLAMTLRRGVLEVEGQRAADMIFWSDTAPKRFALAATGSVATAKA
jgi:hypothetical protein